MSLDVELTSPGSCQAQFTLDVPGPVSLDVELTSPGSFQVQSILDVLGPVSLDVEPTSPGSCQAQSILDDLGPVSLDVEQCHGLSPKPNPGHSGPLPSIVHTRRPETIIDNMGPKS